MRIEDFYATPKEIRHMERRNAKFLARLLDRCDNARFQPNMRRAWAQRFASAQDARRAGRYNAARAMLSTLSYIHTLPFGGRRAEAARTLP